MSAAILRYEAKEAARILPPAPALQRGDGAARLVFARRGDKTMLADLYQRTPCRVLFPRPEPGDLPVAVLLTTSGGLTGGDHIGIELAVEAGAAACVTSQAAEKIYRSLGNDCRIAIDLKIEEGGWLEWLPQETILFDGARLDRRTHASVAPGGRLLAAEMVVLGRIAREETVRTGLLHEGWRLRIGDRLAWVDALRLEGDIAAIVGSPGFGGARALATALYAGQDAGRLMEAARAIAESGENRGGASLVNGVLVARFLGDRPEFVRRDLMRYIAALRHEAAGLPPTLPRVWHS